VKKIFLIIILATSASLALAAPFKTDVVADTIVDKNTLKKISHWVSIFTMYSSVDISDKIDLQEYAKASDLLQSFVQNQQLSARLNTFRKTAYINVYPKGMLNGQEWILKKLNEISDAQYTVLNAPYLTVEVWFTPDATAQSYTVTALFKTTDDKLRAAVAKVNPALSSALLGKTYAQPRLAKDEVNTALFAALDALQAEIGSTFAPNIAIGYNNNIYTNNQTIEVWQRANEGITLRAVDKNDVLLAGPVTWTGVVGTGTTVRFPITKVGHERVTLKAGKDEISVLMNVKEFSLDWKDILRAILKEVIEQLMVEGDKAITQSIEARKKAREEALVPYANLKTLLDRQTNFSPQFEVVEVEVPASASAQGNVLVTDLPNDERYKKAAEAYLKFRQLFVEEQFKEVRKVMLASLLVSGNFNKLGTIMEKDIAQVSAQLIVLLLKGEGQAELKVFVKDYLNRKLDEIIVQQLGPELAPLYAMLNQGATKEEIKTWLANKAAEKIVASLN
jgi:hypothetical protein